MNASNCATSAAGNVFPLSSSGQSAYVLEQLSDSELFEGTRRLIARSNRHLADLLAHLAEVEARGIHRLRACSSLYTYCLYELRLSEDMAYRHARAAKIARSFPILFEQLAAGEIHLTGLLLLGPHLTETNHREVLLRAKHRTKREIEKLVRLLAPLPDVPARIEPLGPVPKGSPMSNGTWQDFVTSMTPVRELEPGLRPKDWMDSEPEANSTLRADSALEASKLEADSALEADSTPEVQSEPGVHWKAELQPRGEREVLSRSGLRSGSGASSAEETRGLERAQFTPELAPQRYKVQFTASQEYVDLLTRAQDLLSHAVPNRSIEELHLRAMRSFVSTLEKRRYATKEALRSTATKEPEPGPKVKLEPMPEPKSKSKSKSEAKPEPKPEPEAKPKTEPEAKPEAKTEPKTEPEATPELALELEPQLERDWKFSEPEVLAEPSLRVANGIQAKDDSAGGGEVSAAPSSLNPRQRVRYTPAEVRRRVQERDGARCAYVDSHGRRCRETSLLEMHHREPFARGGAATPENLTLYCRSHNAFAAEHDFGRAHMAQKTRRD